MPPFIQLGRVAAVTLAIVSGVQGFEPARVTLKITTPAHADNRALCVGIVPNSDDGTERRSCWELQGERAPRQTLVTFVDIRGGGDYQAWASLCRGMWDAARDTCTGAVLQAVPQTFHVVGFGNKGYPRKHTARQMTAPSRAR